MCVKRGVVLPCWLWDVIADRWVDGCPDGAAGASESVAGVRRVRVQAVAWRRGECGLRSVFWLRLTPQIRPGRVETGSARPANPHQPDGSTTAAF